MLKVDKMGEYACGIPGNMQTPGSCSCMPMRKALVLLLESLLVRCLESSLGSCCISPVRNAAYSTLGAGGAAASYMAATCGADHTVRILDSRTDGQLACIKLPDFPYSFSAAGGLLLVGCGDGSVQVIDIPTLEQQYSLRACENAVRTMQAQSRNLVYAGDDGQVVVYDYK
jgi:WD40 repeat protein